MEHPGRLARRRHVDLLRRDMFDGGHGDAIMRSVESAGTDDVLFYHSRYAHDVRLEGTSCYHLLVVNVGQRVAARCRIGRDELDHACQPGNVTVVPAQMPWAVALTAGMEQIVLALPPDRVAVAAARSDLAEPGLKPQFRGHDDALLSIVREIAQEASFHGGLRWHDLTDELIDGVLRRYQRAERSAPGAGLTVDQLFRVTSYVQEHLSRPISIGELASLVEESEMNFARSFRKRAGVSPHRYVVRLRLHRARKLVAGGMSIAEASLEAGFSHQSHLTNWTRRLYGTTPGCLAKRRVTETCKIDPDLSP